MHQIWGAMDRELRQERVGEAVQWAAMNWAFERGCTRYDLEGIDPAGNPSVYAFKKRLGGNETTLAGKEYYPLGFRGRLLAWIDYGFR
jgi:lipid II:glycine glycyltransferase (peptidoglycan interpeptide bridge formation enzyme)